MWIKLHIPFGDGKKWDEIHLSGPTSMKDFFKRLEVLHPKLRHYMRETVDETIHHILLFRGDYVLKAEDEIGPGDRVVVMMPICGG